MDVVTQSADAVAATAVNDVIHLVAELVENATAFSPPNTRVVISGDAVGRGFAVEIEDRGLGMTPDAIDAANERLASSPEFDLANSERLGLFVVGQLADRHGIKVALRSSHYGGITAIVLLPRKIMVSEYEESDWLARGRLGELPPTAVNGGAPETGKHGPAFGMTGRHRLALSSSSREAAGLVSGSGGSEGAEAAEEPLTSTAIQAPPPPAQDQPPQAGSPMAAAAARPVSSAESTGPSPAVNAAAVGGTYLGLPRRVRLANLAPQLRGQPGGAAPGQAAGSSARPPEQTSSLMAALQAGWLRGRLDDLDSPDAEPESPGGRPAGTAKWEAESDDREVES